jgi:hypothetical protein
MNSEAVCRHQQCLTEALAHVCVQTDGLDKYMSWKLLPMLALVLASSLVLRHAIVKGVFARGKAERRE